ncbi:MAG: hypothetical protein ACOYA8_07465 [Clostridium sp.]|jgi:hypothetical protein
MNTDIIIMLTHNDVTVSNAEEIFEECKDLPAKKWGFKDVGLKVEDMKKLAAKMKAAGKTTYLEVVTYTEEGCLAGAKLAKECGFDYLTGTLPFPSVFEYAKENGLKYSPFAGNVGGSPVVLTGTMEEVAESAKNIIANGASGLDLVSYRYRDGDPVELTRKVVEIIGGDKICIAGSIDTTEKMDLMEEIGVAEYTMGSALFNSKFVKNGTFKENLAYVLGYLHKC